MSGFNVQEFKSTIDANSGLLRNNRFLVEFPEPRALQGKLSNSARQVPFYCKAAPLPGIGILTQDIYRYGYGVIERRPYGMVFNDAMLHFYVDGANVVRGWFRNWINVMVNPGIENGISSKSRITGYSAYEHSYKTEYATDVRITSFDSEGNPKIRVVLSEAYPNYVGETYLDWDDKNQNMLLPISLTYRDWYEESTNRDVR